MRLVAVMCLCYASVASAQDCETDCAVVTGQQFIVFTEVAGATPYRLLINDAVVPAPMQVIDGLVEFTMGSGLPTAGTYAFVIDAGGVPIGQNLLTVLPRDETPPVIQTLTATRTGNSGNYQVTAIVMEDRLATIHIFVDGIRQLTCYASPCSGAVSIKGRGQHAVTAAASDVSGNVASYSMNVLR